MHASTGKQKPVKSITIGTKGFTSMIKAAVLNLQAISARISYTNQFGNTLFGWKPINLPESIINRRKERRNRKQEAWKWWSGEERYMVIA